MSKNFFENQSHSILIIFLILAGYFFLMFGNGVMSLTHPDEVFYVQSAKEMVQHNSWLTPLIFDWPQFEKPIFFYWLLAGVIKIFGPTPFAARFWPAFFGILGVLASYSIAWTLFRKKRAAFLSGIILMTSWIYLALSRAVLTDMVFSIWVAIALGFFCWGYYERRYRERGIILFFVFTGTAILTKGFLGFLFCLTPVFAFLIYKKDFVFLKTKSLLLGIFLLALIALPWHVLMYRWYGQEFFAEYWQNVHVRRIFAAEHPKNDTWYFYLMIMFAGMMPWSLFLIPTAGMIYKFFSLSAENRDRFAFLLFWITAVYVFVQPAHSKLASYIFPVFPAMAVLLAFYFEKILESGTKRIFNKSVEIVGYLMAVILTGLGIAAIIMAQKYSSFVPGMVPVYIFTSVAIGLAAVLAVTAFKRHCGMQIAVNASITCLILVVMLISRPYVEPWVSCKDISIVLNAQDRSTTTLLTSKFYARGVRFYTDRKVAVININGKGFFSPHPIPFLNTDEKVLNFLKEQPVTYGIVRKADLSDLRRITSGVYQIHKLEAIGGKQLIRIEKMSY